MTERDEDDMTRFATGGLASAFTAAVAEKRPAATSTPDDFHYDDWYVGINGVPVGPMRLTTLRQKAMLGVVNADSLVWREGFEEWQPLRTYPELLAIVEEGASAGHIGPESAPMTTPLHGGLEQMAGAATGPVVITEAQQNSTGGLAGPIDDVEFGLPKRRAPGWLPYVAVVVALMFGLTIGFVVFSSQKQEPIVKYVEVPVSANTPGIPPPPSEGKSDTIEESQVEGPSKSGAKGGPIAKADPGGGKDESKGGLDIPKSGGLGLGSLKGPSAGPGDSPGPGNGQGLDSSQLSSTVSRYKGSVKRGCWQPALDTRAKDAPTSARVNVTINIAPSGSVTSASTSGDPKGYRGLASCIGSRVRGWQFPASGGPTTVNVPFVFASQ